MLIRTNKDELAAVELLGPIERQYPERDPPTAGRCRQRLRIGFRAEIKQCEPFAERVIDGALRRKPEMGRARAGAIKGRVALPAVRR
jgi:hypothetical protein